MLKCFILIWLISFTFCSSSSLSIDELVHLACESGDLYGIYDHCIESSSAEMSHTCAGLELILNSNLSSANSFFWKGKNQNAGASPPLAVLHLQGKLCGGLGDMFYVAAVIIKENSQGGYSTEKLTNAFSTMITLTSDSGLHLAAEKHLHSIMAITPEDDSIQFRAALLTPGVFESNYHVRTTRALLAERIDRLADHEFSNKTPLPLNEFVMSPTFYFVYQGYNDKDLLMNLHAAYQRANPSLSAVEISSTSASSRAGGRINVGFVSSFFRRHSICKLFCGIMMNLDKEKFNVYAFSSLPATNEDDHTLALRRQVTYVSIGKTFVQNRNEVTSRRIDILVYLDVGMEPSTMVWAAARLAPVQMCTWGHPTTTGLASMDYYLSSALYHRHHRKAASIARALLDGKQEGRDTATAQDSFSEQLVLLDSLNFYFERPVLSALLGGVDAADDASKLSGYHQRLVSRDAQFYSLLLSGRKLSAAEGDASQHSTVGEINSIDQLLQFKAAHPSTPIVLCPQHLPKFHPKFDDVLLQILLQAPDAIIVLLESERKVVWRHTLLVRWKQYLAKAIKKETGRKAEESAVRSHLSRIVWLKSLSPQEYLLLLSVGDVMADPFPFGGGVTTLEALAVCTPVVTCPSCQSVPMLASGMLETMLRSESSDADAETTEDGRSLLIVEDERAFVESVLQLLRSARRGYELLPQLRKLLCNRANGVFEQKQAVSDWEALLLGTATI